jgi:hypothetical protein
MAMPCLRTAIAMIENAMILTCRHAQMRFSIDPPVVRITVA